MDKTKKYGRRTPLFSKRTWERTLTSLGCCLCFVRWCENHQKFPVRIVAIRICVLEFRLQTPKTSFLKSCRYDATSFTQIFTHHFGWLPFSKHGKLGSFPTKWKASNHRKIRGTVPRANASWVPPFLRRALPTCSAVTRRFSPWKTRENGIVMLYSWGIVKI